MKSSIIAIAEAYHSGMNSRFVVLPFGKALKLRREKLGLTQGALAERITSAGSPVDQSAISRWELRANALRDRFFIEGLAAALDTNTNDLIEGRVPAEWAGVYDITPPTLPEWQQDLITEYAPDTPIEKSRELLTRFNKLDPGLWDSILQILNGLSTDEPNDRTQHGT